ncbi:MAG: glutamate 5-kinase, partial [Deltaproteobacteria bacterium]|nr:glutamate 5-kinase [Deltaproteobacteria bacterium]
DEIKFGDNDELSALATNLVEADLLVILTDIDGLYDTDPGKNPEAKKIGFVKDIDSLDIVSICGAVGRFGTGGMTSKCEAAKKASHFGAATVIADGFTDGILAKILNNEDTGTFFAPREDRLTSRKHWIAFSTRPAGMLFVDDGAKEAVLKKGKSLLPSGIRDVDGTFDAGEVVRLVDLNKTEFARGVANYGSEEIRKIQGRKTSGIEQILGYKVYDEVIHRDNLVVL